MWRWRREAHKAGVAPSHVYPPNWSGWQQADVRAVPHAVFCNMWPRHFQGNRTVFVRAQNAAELPPQQDEKLQQKPG